MSYQWLLLILAVIAVVAGRWWLWRAPWERRKEMGRNGNSEAGTNTRRDFGQPGGTEIDGAPVAGAREKRYPALDLAAIVEADLGGGGSDRRVFADDHAAGGSGGYRAKSDAEVRASACNAGASGSSSRPVEEQEQDVRRDEAVRLGWRRGVADLWHE